MDCQEIHLFIQLKSSGKHLLKVHPTPRKGNPQKLILNSYNAMVYEPLFQEYTQEFT